jgi:hypothetical protein
VSSANSKKIPRSLNEFDDDTLESLKRYFGVEESEHSELVKYIKVSRLISEPDDWNEKLVT